MRTMQTLAKIGRRVSEHLLKMTARPGLPTGACRADRAIRLWSRTSKGRVIGEEKSPGCHTERDGEVSHQSRSWVLGHWSEGLRDREDEGAGKLVDAVAARPGPRMIAQTF
jgi:hypothetical protein